MYLKIERVTEEFEIRYICIFSLLIKLRVTGHIGKCNFVIEIPFTFSVAI